jgi:hypothetical protein
MVPFIFVLPLSSLDVETIPLRNLVIGIHLSLYTMFSSSALLNEN